MGVYIGVIWAYTGCFSELYKFWGFEIKSCTFRGAGFGGFGVFGLLGFGHLGFNCLGVLGVCF